MSGLECLLKATHNASALVSTASSFPTSFPDIKHHLLPPINELGASGDIDKALSVIKWSECFPSEVNITGGNNLCKMLKEGINKHLCILIFHAGGDPKGSPVAWVPLTEKLSPYSTIVYAFP